MRDVPAASKARFGLGNVRALLYLAIVSLAGELALRWRHRRRGVSWADEGLRPETRALRWPDLASCKRIVVLGDSIAYGHGLDAAEAYPALLQMLLRERHPSARLAIINAGIPGHTVAQGWARLAHHALRYRPHLVLVQFGLNDIHLTRSSLDIWRERAFWASRKPWGRAHALLSRSCLYRILAARIMRFYRLRTLASESGKESEPRLSPAAFAACLREVVRQVRRAGAEVMLCTMTPIAPGAFADWQPEARQRQRALYEAYNLLIRSVALETRAALFEAWCLFPAEERSLWMEDGIHLTARGQRLLAEGLAGAVWPLLGEGEG